MNNKILATCLLVASPLVQADGIAIGTLPQGTLAYASGAALARELGEQSGERVSVVPQGGPPVTLPMVASGELDASFATAIAAAFAYRGMGEFSSPVDDLRIIATVYPLDFSFFVRADSPYYQITDLQGADVPWGFTQQRNNGAVVEAYLASGGLGRDDISPVLVPNALKSLDDFSAGRVDVVSHSVGSGRELELNASVGGLRYLGLGDDPEFGEFLAEHVPGALVRTLKADESDYASEDIDIITTPFVIVGSVHTSDEAAYQLVKTLHTRQAALAEAVPAFADMPLDALAVDVGIPVHPGTERYLREVELWQGDAHQ
ncbi:TAXI family TRAP transporter solute-binding subunit [Halomonas denitrificans]|uniref:TAXI family TRAP transporter solute-binding subunit n=1 Tax=Halomonas TaxID=2745 RepID=UPI001C9874FD|nr:MULTISPECIES: TAXI family TRAP transporter solute-binding subunit [Halomonas]MBY5929112.1 TAXI family TRAP transporter solute-binding subunit [Halomonas sp. DP8Y7-3]MCA0973969.1 TAXI family TRAP transporter solute-binding subunit [Halomonas denitrificans]